MHSGARGHSVTLEFFVACVPPKTSHHSKKIVNIPLKDGRHFTKLADSKELREARASLLELLQPFAPAEPIPAPVSLAMEFTWPWRAGDSQRTRRFGRIPCTVAPDLDNACKTAADCLVLLGFVARDSEICDLHLRKWIGEQPGIRVRLERFQGLELFEAARAAEAR